MEPALERGFAELIAQPAPDSVPLRVNNVVIHRNHPNDTLGIPNSRGPVRGRSDRSTLSPV